MAVIWSLIALHRLEKASTVSRKCSPCCRAPGQGDTSQKFPTGKEVPALTLCWWNPWLILTRFSSWSISGGADILRTPWSMTGNSTNCGGQEKDTQINMPFSGAQRKNWYPGRKAKCCYSTYFFLKCICLFALTKFQRGCLCRFLEQLLNHPLKQFVVYGRCSMRSPGS